MNPAMLATSIIVMLSGTLLGQSATPLDSFYEEFASKRNNIQVLRARFSQTTTTPDETIKSTGQIVYSNPKRILFRYDEPELSYMLDGERAYEYDAELQQLQIVEIGDRPEAEAFYLGFEQNPQRLKEAYSVRVVALLDSTGKGTELEITPRDPESDTAFFKKIRMRLRISDFLPTKIRIINDEDSDVIYDIGEFSVNDPRDVQENRIFLPEGTMIIENDEFVETVGANGKYVPVTIEAPPVGPESQNEAVITTEDID